MAEKRTDDGRPLHNDHEASRREAAKLRAQARAVPWGEPQDHGRKGGAKGGAPADPASGEVEVHLPKTLEPGGEARGGGLQQKPEDGAA